MLFCFMAKKVNINKQITGMLFTNDPASQTTGSYRNSRQLKNCDGLSS